MRENEWEKSLPLHFYSIAQLNSLLEGKKAFFAKKVIRPLCEGNPPFWPFQNKGQEPKVHPFKATTFRNADQKIIITLFFCFYRKMHYPMRFFVLLLGLCRPGLSPKRLVGTYPDGHKCHVSLSLFYVTRALPISCKQESIPSSSISQKKGRGWSYHEMA